MKLSTKKEAELYQAVSEEIMQTRIKTLRYLKQKLSVSEWDEVDEFFFHLTLDAPQAAIKIFKPKPQGVKS